jgi:hypothetical protein
MSKKRNRTEYMHQWYLKHHESELQKNREYYAENTQKCKDLSREWRKSNPEQVKAQKRRHTVKYIDRELAKIKRWKEENPQRDLDAAREYVRRVKQEFVDAYGGRCTCCGEGILEFLTCEHINRDGHIDARNGYLGRKMYAKAKRESYPKDRYTVLCMNCNYAQRFGKTCPHKAQRLREQFSVVAEGLRDVAG